MKDNRMGNKEIRVLHVINSLETGGAQKLVADILRHLKDHDVVKTGILTFQNSKDSHLYKMIESADGIALYDLSKENPSRLAIIRKIREIGRDYDIIHAHLFPAGYYTAIATIGLGKAVFYTEHSTHNRRRDKKFLLGLERFIYSRYTEILAISGPVKDALAHWLRSDKVNGKIRTIHNGVDLSLFDEAAETGKTLSLGDDKRGVIMISRFTDSKDHATLIEAMAHIRNEDLIAIFAGEGETLDRHKELARDLGVEDKCLFLGTRTDIPDLIKSSFIGVQSSNWEGFGLTAVEMMAGGLPVVASDVPGLNEVVGGAGILFPRGDARKLAETLDSLASDRKRYEDVRNRCMERATRYDIRHTVNRHIEIYGGVLRKQKK